MSPGEQCQVAGPKRGADHLAAVHSDLMMEQDDLEFSVVSADALDQLEWFV